MCRSFVYVVLFVVCVDLCRLCSLHRYFAVLCRYYFVCFVYHYVSIYKHNNKHPSPPLKKKYLKKVLLKGSLGLFVVSYMSLCFVLYRYVDVYVRFVGGFCFMCRCF